MELPDRMLSVVTHGPEDYRLEEIATPTAGPGEVLIRVEAAGVCAGDAKCFYGAPLFWGDEHREGYCQPPITPGHEFVGVVVALGEGAGEKYGLQIGDRAVSEQIVPCWECRFCERGQYWMCQRHDIYGFRQVCPGGMAQYMRFPAGAINHKVPPSIPAHHAALIEPLACSIHAVQRADIGLGDVVVISGCGTLGLGMVAAARLQNPALLIALDLIDERLEVATKCGADMVLNPNETDAIERVRELTEGYGCDIYIEATGAGASVVQGLHMIRRLGTFVEFSVFSDPITVDWTIIGDTKELDIRGSHLGPYCYPIAIRMLAQGQVPADDIVTHRLPLEQHDEAFQLVHSAERSIKVVLEP
jgi:threonine dehydrogenase-like Zn-dependent dehydrogenase